MTELVQLGQTTSGAVSILYQSGRSIPMAHTGMNHPENPDWQCPPYRITDPDRSGRAHAAGERLVELMDTWGGGMGPPLRHRFGHAIGIEQRGEAHLSVLIDPVDYLPLIALLPIDTDAGDQLARVATACDPSRWAGGGYWVDEAADRLMVFAPLPGADTQMARFEETVIADGLLVAYCVTPLEYLDKSATILTCGDSHGLSDVWRPYAELGPLV